MEKIKNAIYTGILGVGLLSSSPINADASQGEVKQPAQSCCSGACFPTRVAEAGKPPLLFRGCAEYTYLWFNLYTGALYASEDCRDIFDGACAKELQLQYKRGFSVDNFVDGAITILQRQNALNNASLKEKVSAFHKFYRPVKEGDSYSLRYYPEVGTSLLLNGQSLGVIPGEDFANAYFGIWLGNDSLNDSAEGNTTKGQLTPHTFAATMNSGVLYSQPCNTQRS